MRHMMAQNDCIQWFISMCLITEESYIFRNVQPGKIFKPNKWDTACGGHIDLGENVEEALKREIKEELGITDYIPERIGQYVFESDCEKELVYVHKTTYNEQIFPNAQELNGGRFWTKTEIESNLGKDIFTPNFESEYKRFFHKEE